MRLPVLKKIGAVAFCPTLPLQLAREKADLVVIHEPNPMALVAYFLARPAGKLIVWFHSEVIRPSWRYRMFYRPVSAVRALARIANCRGVADAGGLDAPTAAVAVRNVS